MFKLNDYSKTGFDTLIGSNTQITGSISSNGMVRIDGEVNGNINIEGDIFLGESSVINGDVTASNVNIAGKVKGNIFTSGVLRLLPTARLIGDIQVKSFVSEEGSVFEGMCRMTDNIEANAPIINKKNEYKKSDALGEYE
jgi:cytoskeletal protein CcmA (bactofilin family)